MLSIDISDLLMARLVDGRVEANEDFVLWMLSRKTSAHLQDANKDHLGLAILVLVGMF